MRSFLISCFALAGCVQTVPNPEGPRDAGSDRFDSSVEADADTDADSDVVASECFCPESRRPVCLIEEGATCVECTEEKNRCPNERPVCGPENTCVECTAADVTRCPPALPHCLAGSNVCVGCNEDSDCGEELPACTSEHTCAACTDDAQCARFGRVCDEPAGRCVRCTADTEAAQCRGKSCHLGIRECTQTDVASVGPCKACATDSECQADHRCIEMSFGTGPTRVPLGAYCLKRLATGCAPPYGSAPIRRVSVSGAPAEDYCGLSEARTSCEAVLDLLRGKPCPGGQDAECGAPGGLCGRVNGITGMCSYACENNLECPSNAPCADQAVGNYCGRTPP